MPKNKDIKKVLVIGSGAIVIGQAAEFDYSGTQACLALKDEGIEVILVNNNPATIMTDKTISDKVYFEPLNIESLMAIIKIERPDGLLATVGGQTGLNLAMALSDAGILAKFNIKLLGTNIDSIRQAEDREQFRALMNALNEPVPQSDIIYSIESALEFAEQIGYPLIVRPAYTLGGFGGGIAQDEATYITLVGQGLSASPIKQCLVEKSIAGYKEIEYEVMRDAAGTCITVCNMENFDPVGVHTGDSIVVAPSQTMNDREYHMLRSASINIIEALGIIGACNVQFALHPETSAYYLIEVNPRVSRSSALASKATGYPIAKIAAKLAIGYSLSELKNPVTGTTFASFEPALDYVTVKIPRWPFDQFQDANRLLGTQMKATGEVMAIERGMEAALQKAIRSLDIKLDGFRLPVLSNMPTNQLETMAVEADDRRLFVLFELLIRNKSIHYLQQLTGITPYFLYVLKRIVDEWHKLHLLSWDDMTSERLLQAKKLGFSDQQLAGLWEISVSELWGQRKSWNLLPAYRVIDTCAAEFRSQTNYYYSSWNGSSDVRQSARKKVAVIGSGPIRIGQGIEFDYCCVHSVMALQKLGYEAIMINNNPETVSTDYEIADALYFEPLTAEDILNVLDFENITDVIVQFGGQTSLNVAAAIEEAGINVLGSSADLLDQMEDRDRFYSFLESIGLQTIPSFTASTPEEVPQFAEKLGYPVLLRPSYVIGGKGMNVLNNKQELEDWLAQTEAVFPVLVDHFITGKEVETDILTDGENTWVSAVFEHIEGTGVHSGDSISITPPVSLTNAELEELTATAKHIAKNMDYTGLFNIQFVYEEGQLFVMEINPRASRTAPISAKVTDVPLVQLATALMLGVPYHELDIANLYNGQPEYTVKAPVFSHIKLPGLSPVLSPEMMSTGEVIGQNPDSAIAMQKALIGASQQLADLTEDGSIFITEKSLPLVETDFWESQGFTLFTEASLPFTEWLKTTPKKAYIDLTPNPDKVQASQAAVHRLHVWTRIETINVFKEPVKYMKSKKGVLAK
ncbi:carbamoyl phosphate synthase large subunit [Planococcus salinarum]|uniref:carbamoyl-phosphate synthase (ammonia) n=1 Tax=Planococcus salinarum TaxID=622695 RepID=A0ABX3D0P5_9BACL|nr:carbamoyl-phosphate synthase (glutamine-hydrolyzing) large subunit [Planococcus salinarum]OHX51958.1 carbamoyl phosphate synthase large subunit [Planococcus salinarum]TAA69685.1 carbamoyl-phosphate synthase (glutamine-hydrolyzing) large subunit [Planococcus salinarum]